MYHVSLLRGLRMVATELEWEGGGAVEVSEKPCLCLSCLATYKGVVDEGMLTTVS